MKKAIQNLMSSLGYYNKKYKEPLVINLKEDIYKKYNSVLKEILEKFNFCQYISTEENNIENIISFNGVNFVNCLISIKYIEESIGKQNAKQMIKTIDAIISIMNNELTKFCYSCGSQEDLKNYMNGTYCDYCENMVIVEKII